MSKTGSAEAAVVRCQRALALRIAGARYRQIGAQLGVSHQTAFRDVTAALAEIATHNTEKAERLRQIESERCEAITRALWPKVEAGDERAARVVVTIMERRAKLFGLDARTQTSVTSEDGGPVTVIHQYIP